MRSRVRLVPVLAATVVLSLAIALPAQQPSFRSGARSVPIYVTVTDGNNRLITDLMRDDFEILDNGRPQELTIFDNEIRPFRAVVMLDTSISMTRRLKDLYAGAEQFLLRLLPHDKATVGGFNDKIEFASEFTSNRDSLISALKHLDFGNETHLYDALYASLDQLEKADERKVILLFTDGEGFRQPPGARSRVGAGPQRRSDDLRHRPRNGVLQWPEPRAKQAG
jgi:Ca-activated chloride channel family protein